MQLSSPLMSQITLLAAVRPALPALQDLHSADHRRTRRSHPQVLSCNYVFYHASLGPTVTGTVTSSCISIWLYSPRLSPLLVRSSIWFSLHLALSHPSPFIASWPPRLHLSCTIVCSVHVQLTFEYSLRYLHGDWIWYNESIMQER